MKPWSACAVLAAVALTAACASSNVSTIPYPNLPDFPATDPARVEILRVEPARPHVKLGEIMVEISSTPPPSVQEVDGMLRVAAAKLGADAAVVVSNPMAPGAVASSAWWSGAATRTTRELIAVAVKYR